MKYYSKVPTYIIRDVPIIVVLLLLCQCAVKHQPKNYSAYFQEGFSTKKEREQHRERVVLEGDYSNLSLLQKKRLYDLYDSELSRVKEGDPLRKYLEEKSSILQAEISTQLDSEPYTTAIEKNREKINLEYSWNIPLKKAKDLWNKDENEKALAILEEISTQEEFTKTADLDEKYRVQLLKFRILQDNLASPLLLIQYARLKELAPCRAETTQAGFVLALRAYLIDNKEEALSLFEKQCDEDKGMFNDLRRTYWLYQFHTDTAKREEAYTKLMKFPIYGYYQYLAKASRHEDYLVPVSLQTISLQEFSVSGGVSDSLTEAEKRLEGNLKRDSLKFILKASDKLKTNPDENVEALIYVMRLFQASGNHLEAVKLYGNMQSGFKDNMSFEKLNKQSAFLYPRPFKNTVEWVTKQWGVEKNFVWSIMRQESAFNAFATSIADARGLMQLMPFLAKEMSKEWKYNSTFRDKGMYSTDENIKMGVFHLHQLFKYLEHPALVAASYNAGIQRTSRWTKRMGNMPLDVFVELIPINETRNYVKLVLRNYIHYQAMDNNGIVDKSFISLRLPPTVLP